MDEEMRLPEDKTCADCVSCRRCCSMFGVTPDDKYCDFHPVRFNEKDKPMTKDKAEHTPTPWKVNKSYNGFISGTMHSITEITAKLPEEADHDEFESEGICVVITPHDTGYKKELPTREANANHIVKCVNMHDELVAALKECREYFDGCMDADYQGEETGYVPNEEMTKHIMIEELLKKAKS